MRSIIDLDEFFKEGIAKYFIGRGVFKQKPAYSVVTAESAVVKALIVELRAAIRLSSLCQLDQIEDYRLQEAVNNPIKAPDTMMTVFRNFTLLQPPSGRRVEIGPKEVPAIGFLKDGNDTFPLLEAWVNTPGSDHYISPSTKLLWKRGVFLETLTRPPSESGGICQEVDGTVDRKDLSDESLT